MRDYTRFDEYVGRLTGDIYAQPPDPGHQEWAVEAIDWLMTTVFLDRSVTNLKVLDIGCGFGITAPAFTARGFDYRGIAIGEDVVAGPQFLIDQGYPAEASRIEEMDMTFLDAMPDGHFDLLFARHVLEHSPFPIITLMEWRRVVKRDGFLCLVAPAPHYWKYRGRNHYSVVPKELIEWWLLRSGWQVLHEFVFDNRNASFLRHLSVYQSAIGGARSADVIDRVGKSTLDAYPPGPVEFRFICKRCREVVE